ncbi:MAG: RluA family pseudouridine synthase, partial [Verrucomicrobiota bacterium]
KLAVDHPDDGHRVAIEAPIPHDLAIALKYLRKYAAAPRPVHPRSESAPPPAPDEDETTPEAD